MTILSKQYPMDLGTGSIEQVRQSAPKIDMELGAIYGHLNNIRTRYRSATAPTNPEAGQVWEDTVNNKIMKWNGSAWSQDIGVSINLTNRNTVLQGTVDGSGNPTLIQGNAGALKANLVATTETIIAIPAGHDATVGNLDYIVSFSATQNDFWTSLPANNTSYLFVDYSSGTVTGTYSVIAPVYQSYAPSHSAGKHWYDTNKEQWYVSDGSNWVAKYRGYVGSVVTDGTKVTATTIEPYNVIRSAVPMSYLDTDGTLAANSDSKIATQKAVKAYVDANAGGDASIGTGNYIVEPFEVTPGTGLEVSIAANRCVIDETVCESTTATTVALTAKAAQLIYKKKDNTYDKLIAAFASIDASNVLRWDSTAWDGSSAIAATVGTNNLTKNGTASAVDGILGGNGAQGNGSSGYLKAANTTNIPAYASAGTHHHAFWFVSNGAAQCFYHDGVVKIACDASNNLRVGGVDTGYTLTTLTDYKVSVSRAGGTTTGIVYVQGVAVYSGAVIVNTSVVAPNILSNNTPGEYSSSIWYGTMIDSVERTPAQIATLAQKLLIPCDYGGGSVSVAISQSEGTNIGDFTNLANVFDGNTGTSANRSAGSGYLGKQWDAPKRVTGFMIKGTTSGFDTSSDSFQISFVLRGSHDGTNWDTLYSTGLIADSNIMVRDYQIVYLGTATYTYHSVQVVSGSGYIQVTELQFYTQQTPVQTDIRNALANPTESQIVAFVRTSATAPTTIIAPNDPQGATPDWAYGIRVGPLGISNKTKRLGRKSFSGTSTPEWDNPFGSRSMTIDAEWSTDVAGTNSSQIPNDAANSYPSILINGKIRETITTGVLVAGASKTSGYVDAICEVID